jgi:aspartyl-tRNA(Asn)/glutamyl-tRNA(Gln) amidotransferase subunit A
MQELDLENLTITNLAHQIKTKKISPVELAKLFFERIKRLNPALTAYTVLMEKKALADSKLAEREIMRGDYKGPLHGMPFAIKDNIAIKGENTTAGSKVLADWKPSYDATVITKIKDTRGIILGKTNMHEWAGGGSTNNPYFGTTRNPWDLRRIPGGSSGGSAAAVAASLCLASIGTDNAGSVRNPASLCGVVGLKPTYGRVSRFGGVHGTGAFSMDHFGIFTKTVKDCAIVLEAIAGKDLRDPLSADETVSRYTKSIGKPVKSLTLGVVNEYFDDFTTGDVKSTYLDALKLLRSLGLKIKEVSIPHIDLAPAVHTCTSRVENGAAHRFYMKANPHAYSKEMLFRQIVALTIPAATYINSQRIRRLICEEFGAALRKVDLIAAPTMPMTAPTIEEYEQGFIEIKGKKFYLQDEKGNLGIRFSLPFNLTGHPAISICCGFDNSDLPLGIQLVAGMFQEDIVFRVADAYERASGWYTKKPQLH